MIFFFALKVLLLKVSTRFNFHKNFKMLEVIGDFEVLSQGWKKAVGMFELLVSREYK